MIKTRGKISRKTVPLRECTTEFLTLTNRVCLLAGNGCEAEGPGAGEGVQGRKGHGEGEQQVRQRQVEDEDVAGCAHLLGGHQGGSIIAQGLTQRWGGLLAERGQRRDGGRSAKLATLINPDMGSLTS
jgi:hypothetical protein